jgi:hypothetical protein
MRGFSWCGNGHCASRRLASAPARPPFGAHLPAFLLLGGGLVEGELSGVVYV